MVARYAGLVRRTTPTPTCSSVGGGRKVRAGRGTTLYANGAVYSATPSQGSGREGSRRPGTVARQGRVENYSSATSEVCLVSRSHKIGSAPTCKAIVYQFL